MEQFREIAEQYKLLGDKTRLMILSLLKENELCVCSIVEAMNMSQPNVSQHLRKLKTAGLVQENRRGQWVYYSLNIDDKPSVEAALKYVPSMQDTIHQLKINC